jgi:hypothetical protein
MSSKTPLRRSGPSAAPSGPFAPPREQDPRTPEPPKWDGSKGDLPEPQYLPQFKNYQFRYGAYPGFRDWSKKPLWPDGAVSEHARRQESPVKPIVGRLGRTNFKRDERVCGDLQFGMPTVSNSIFAFHGHLGLDRRAVAVFHLAG